MREVAVTEARFPAEAGIVITAGATGGAALGGPALPLEDDD